MSDTAEDWERRASDANSEGFRLLYAAMKCFDLAQAAKALAKEAKKSEADSVQRKEPMGGKK